MRLSRNKCNSLRFKTILEIQEKHKGLIETGFRVQVKHIWDYICSSNGYWVIFIIMSVLLLCFALVPLLDVLSFINIIKISPKTANILVDQRTGNIAAIISITLVVVGFLISNLAIKGTVSYKLMFKKTKLYSIFYYTISLMILMFIVSSLRETIASDFFVRLVVVCTYLSILGLCLVGYLFKRLIRFTSNKYVRDLKRKAFSEEFKENLKEELIQDFSQRIFKQKMEDLGVSRYNSFTGFSIANNNFRYPGFEDTQEENSDVKKVNRLKKKIYDINIIKLESIIKKSRTFDSKIVYMPELSLGKEIEVGRKIVWHAESSKIGNYFECLKQGLTLKKVRKIELKEIGEDIDKSFELASKANDNHELEYLLDSYFDLYELCKDVRVEDTELLNVSRIIFTSLKKSVNNNNIDAYQLLDGFVCNVIYLGLYNNKYTFFKTYICFQSQVYDYIQESKIDLGMLSSEFYKEFTEFIAHRYKSTIDSLVSLSMNNTIGMKKELNRYLILCYESFTYMIYKMIRYKDLSSYENALEDYSKIRETNFEEDYILKSEIHQLRNENIDGINNKKIKELTEEYIIKSEFLNLWEQGILGIKYWLYYLYSLELYISEELNKYLSIMDNKFGYIDVTLNRILEFRSSSYSGNMVFERWDYKKRRGMYTPPSPEDWLLLGVLLDKIRNKALYFHHDEIEIETTSDVSSLYNSVKSFLDNLNYIKWKDVLKVKDEQEFNNRKTELLNSLNLYRNTFEIDKIHAIAEAELSSIRIEKFKNDVGESWKSSLFIRKIFQEKKNIEVLEKSSLDKSFIAIHSYLYQYKSNFIDEKHKYFQSIGGLSYFGEEIAKGENNNFFKAVIESTNASLSDESLIILLDKAIERILSKEKSPNIIFMPPRLLSSKDTSLIEHKKFKKNISKDNSKENIENLKFGDYKDIPIVKAFSPLFKDKIIVCDFEAAFRMNVENNAEWYADNLIVEVRKLTDDEAKNLFAEDPDKWKNNDKKISLSDEEAIELVKTSVIVKMGVKVSYEICDMDSFVVGEILTSKN